MIITSIIILIITGLSHELQAPLHYKYKYFASVSTGIPELSSQASGWAMKADVEVFVQESDVTVIFKLSNTRTVEFNENLGCDSRGEIPDSRFASISDPDLASAIEAPFRVRLYGDEGQSVEYHEGKYRWLANFRKGIASTFKNEILRGNTKSEKDSIFRSKNPPNVFAVKEETIFGKCEVGYTWSEIPSHISGRPDLPYKEQKEMDVQLEGSETKEANSQASTNSATGAPKNISYLHVVRTVNFDSCSEMVGFQINSIEYSEVTKGQHEWRRGRSSVSEYIFLGKHRKFRMERAVIEGATLVAPFGFQTELLQARTNQTFQLVSVTKGGEIPQVSDEIQISSTWMYEVLSFAEYPTHSYPRPWVVYTGEGDAIGRFQTFGVDYTSSEQIEEIKKVIISKVTTAAAILSDQYQGFKVDRTESPSKLLQDSSFLFKFLSEKTALEVFGTFFEKDSNNTNVLARKLVIDAAAASGFHYVTEAIMVYIREGKLSDLQVATFFMTLASNAECACAIPGILDWVLTLDIKERPFLTSTVLINFAHLVKEMCLYPKARNVNFAGPSFGDAKCHRQKIMKEFRPYVAKLLEDENEWVNIVGIFVISALADSNSLVLVVPFIENKHLYSNILRVQAIYALEKEHLERYDHLESHIVHLLTQIYVNIEENVAVREAALTVISTWNEDPSFYHTLARMSWREPSKRFASFITSFIKNEAGFGIAAASFALKLSKPTIPSLTFSNTFTSYRTDEKKHINSFDSIDVFKSKTLSDIIHLSLYSDYKFGDFDFSILWATMFMESGPVIQNLLHYFSEFKTSDVRDRGINKNIFEKIEKILKFIFNVPEAKKKDDYLNIYVKFLQHLQVLLPVNKYTLSNLANPSFFASQVVEFLRNESELVLGKFFNPVDFTMFHPTELGLPLFISGSSPAVLTDVSSLRSKEYPRKPDLVTFSLVSFSSEFRSKLSVLLPWNQKQIETGITSTRDITLPFQMSVGLLERGAISRLSLGLECTYLNESFSVAKASNAPYTRIGPIVPLGDDPSKKIISKSEPKKHSVPILRQFTDFDLHLALEAEEPTFLFPNWNPIDLLSSKQTSTPYMFYAYASPTVKYWSADLKFDAISQYNKINLDVFRANADKNEIASQFKAKMAREQENGKQEVDEKEDNICRNIYQKKTFLEHCFGEFVTTNIINFIFTMNQFRSYEIMTTATEEQNSESSKIKWFYIQLLHEIEGMVTLVCLDFKQSMPFFSSLDSFENVINADLHKKIRVDLTPGCEGDPVLTVQGLYQISDEWKSKYQNCVQESCDFDPLDPLHTFTHNAVYDHVNFSVTFNKDYYRKMYPITAKLSDYGSHLLSQIFTQKCENKELENKVEIKLNRCPVSENWFIDFHGQVSETQYVLPHSNLFNSLFGVADKDAEYYPSHFSNNRESDKCIIGSDLVRNFDGFTFHYKSTECWIVAAQSCSTKARKLLVRYSGSESTLEAKYIDDTKGLVIEFLKNTLMVNGKVVDASNGKETIKNDDGKDLVVIERKNHYYSAKLSKNSYINFKDRVEVRTDTGTWGDICGLCGNNDGEPEGDLVGPQGCIYDDPSTFAASWAEESDLCDQNTLSELKEDAKTEQHAPCQTDNHISKKDILCMAHEWNATYMERDFCISPWPIPYCEDTCDITEYSDVSVTYNCWPQDFVPVVIKDSSELTEEEYLESLGYEHHWEEERWISIPKYCKKATISS